MIGELFGSRFAAIVHGKSPVTRFDGVIARRCFNHNTDGVSGMRLNKSLYPSIIGLGALTIDSVAGWLFSASQMRQLPDLKACQLLMKCIDAHALNPGSSDGLTVTKSSPQAFTGGYVSCGSTSRFAAPVKQLPLIGFCTLIEEAEKSVAATA